LAFGSIQKLQRGVVCMATIFFICSKPVPTDVGSMMPNDWKDTEDNTALDTQHAIEKAEEDEVTQMFTTMHEVKPHPEQAGLYQPWNE
jgi:hypothetical protein